METTTINGIENVTLEFLSMIKLPEANGNSLNYLMVMPVLTIDNNIQYYFKIGFASVCAALKASGRNVFTTNLNYKLEPLKLLNHVIMTKKIDVVLTSGFSLDFHAVKMIIDAAKEIKPDIITVVGGGIISADPVTAMTALENADYGVIGEGEISVNSLAYALEIKKDAADVDGVICFRDGEWSIRDNWPMVHDLNVLPFPDYEGFEYSRLFEKKYDNNNGVWNWTQSSYIAYIMPSRSCPFNCTFCFHTCGSRYKRMKVETIKKYIDWLLSFYPIELVHFADELSFSDRQHTMELCRLLKSYNFGWFGSIRGDGSITKEMLAAMKESGCSALYLGIESADNNILKSMRKRTTIEQIEKVFDYSVEIGLDLKGYLIFGDPEETTETFWRSINWMQLHKASVANIFLLRVFPGSQIYKDACEKGIIRDPVQFLKDGCPPVNLSKMTDDEYNIFPVLYRTLHLDNKLEDAEVNPLPDYTVNLAGRCPCCKCIVSYPHESMFNISPRQCPVCCRPLNINAIEYCDLGKMNKNAENLINATKVAVWAINISNFYWLTKSMPALKSDNVYFINKNKIKIPDNGKYVKTFFGKEVFTPDIIQSIGIDTIIVPNNRWVFYEIKEQCADEYPRVKRIVHTSEML